MPDSKNRNSPTKNTAGGEARVAKGRGPQGGGNSNARRFSKRRTKKPLVEAPAVGPEVLNRIQQSIDNGTYIVFDIETTGGNPERNGITEIFALKYHQGEIKDTYYTLVNPGIPIPPIVRRMTGIDNKMVRSAPRISEVMHQIVEFIGHDVLVSHNTIGDMKFIRHFAEQVCKVTLQNFYLCTHLLVEKLAPESPDKSLRGLAEFFDLPRGELHRAEADAYVTLELFKVLVGRLKARSVQYIEEAVRLQGDLESGMRLGWGVTDEAAGQIPPGPGVFYLLDHEKKMLFLSSAMQLDREVTKLRTLHQLPRPLLRLVLRSYDLQVERSPNSYASLLLECEALAQHKVSFHPIGWHQRAVQTLYLAETVEGLRLAQGPLDEGVRQAFGPVRDRRIVGEFIAALAAAFEVEAPRGDQGALLPREAAAILSALMDGTLEAQATALQKSMRSIKLFFRFKERRSMAQRLKTMRTVLAAPKPRMASLLQRTGLLVVPDKTAGSWQVHSIVSSRPRDLMTLKGDPMLKLGSNGIGQKLLEKLRRERERLNDSPLSSQETGQINATLWWLLNGRGEGRFIELDELEALVKGDGKA